jgi:hypothetical protein
MARALLKKASFLSLDEATSALDSRSEKMIQSTFDHITKQSDSGLGFVSIAHRLSTVRNADLIFVLSKGAVVEVGNHALLMAETSRGELSTEEPDQKEKARQAEVQKTFMVPMLRLMGYNRPDWPFLVPAILGVLVEGASMPVIAVVEHGCFAILGEAMTQRLRVAILSALFKQEIGFHDDPEHTPGMLSKALELYAYRVSGLCRTIGNKAAAMSSVGVGLGLAGTAGR